MRLATVCLAVFSLIGLGYLAANLVATVGGGKRWDPELVYAVWCVSAEVAPHRPDGSLWDEDGSPPDPFAELIWRGNRVLESATSRNTLVASWGRSSLQLGDLLRMEFRPSDLDKVARIKADPSESVSVNVYDRDIFASELIGSVEILLGTLKHGINRVEVNDPRSGLRSVSLQIVPAETLEVGGQVPTEVHKLSSTSAEASP
jgi:hypothetical protein